MNDSRKFSLELVSRALLLPVFCAVTVGCSMLEITSSEAESSNQEATKEVAVNPNSDKKSKKGSMKSHKNKKVNKTNKAKGDVAAKNDKSSSFSLSSIDIKPSSSFEIGDTVILNSTLSGYDKSSKGLKISLTGSAVRKRLIAGPNMDSTYLRKRIDGFQIFNQNVEKLIFTRKNSKTLVAVLPEFKGNGKPMDFTISMRGAKSGRGEIELVVESLEGVKAKKNNKEQFILLLPRLLESKSVMCQNMVSRMLLASTLIKQERCIKEG